MNHRPNLRPVRSEIRRTLRFNCVNTPHLQAARLVLGRPGYALHPEGPCRAALLALGVYRAIRGAPSEAAILAAAAVELQMGAASIFDDVADRDVAANGGPTPAEAIPLAITLLSCGSAAACRAVQHLATDEARQRSLMHFYRDSVASCGGQFLDARFETQEAITVEDALEMTSMKSGSLGRFAAAFSASIAETDEEMAGAFGDFGFDLFTYAQLVDDVRDAFAQAAGTSDLSRNKKTVPLVFFRSQRTREGRSRAKMGALPDGVSGHPRQEVHRSEAHLYGAIVAEAYLNRAKRRLARLKARHLAVQGLERLVQSLEFSPQATIAAP